MTTNNRNDLNGKKESNIIFLHDKKNETCIFCGQKVHVESFKGKPICSQCRQTIPALFSYG